MINKQIRQIVQAMGAMMTLGMVGGLAAPVMLQAEYYWVICDYEKKEFWGMLYPQPSVGEAIQAAKDYITEKGSSVFPIGSVRGIEVYTKFPAWFGKGEKEPVKREFIEVGM